MPLGIFRRAVRSVVAGSYASALGGRRNSTVPSFEFSQANFRHPERLWSENQRIQVVDVPITEVSPAYPWWRTSTCSRTCLQVHSDADLAGYGRLVDDPDDFTREKGTFEIVKWPLKVYFAARATLMPVASHAPPCKFSRRDGWPRRAGGNSTRRRATRCSRHCLPASRSARADAAAHARVCLCVCVSVCVCLCV